MIAQPWLEMDGNVVMVLPGLLIQGRAAVASRWSLLVWCGTEDPVFVP